MEKAILLFVLLWTGCFTYGQTTDTLKKTKKIDLLPAVSFSPETSLTMGVIGYYYVDLSKGQGGGTTLSNINFLAAYTLLNQIAVESKWELFTRNNLWRIRGQVFYNRFPDRNYGLGNAADLRILDVEDDETNIYNYLRFNSDRIKFAPVVLRQVADHFYLGLQADLETLYRLRAIADETTPLDEASFNQLDFPVKGYRSGLGLQLLWDSRDNVLNPLQGAYLEFGTYWYNGLLGGDFDFSSYRLDVRKYINTVDQHTLALRAVCDLRFSDEEIPLRGLARVGGREFIRGYFQGTYQDNQMLGFEAEYRWPLWKEDLDAPFWKVWKRLGIVAFVGGAQVAPEAGDFGLDRFNMSAGGGLRILFNKESRLNLRIDYGLGLAKDSGGEGKRQSGLYFFLAEAF